MYDLKQKYLTLVAGAADESALEDIRVSAVGKKGEVSLKMRELGKMTPEEKQVAGPALNALKNEINSAIAAKKEALGDAALNERLQSEWIDVSLSGRPRRHGSIHPISQVTDEVIAIFADLGFSVAEGPQIENDWYNFDALNIAPEHPSRQEMDTFICTATKATSARRMCCARTPRQCKSAIWRSTARRVASFAPVVCTVRIMIRRTRRCSTSMKGCASTKTSRWQI